MKFGNAWLAVSPLSVRAALALALALATLLFAAVGDPRASGTFSPTITIETSTTRATAHPDARITIDNSSSSDNIKDLTLQLPDGFWGSLAAVSTKCTEAQATSGTCPVASKIGTVTASADIVDGDTVANGVLSGGVYLTEAFAANAATDPAGISIKVDTKVGGVDLGRVIVNARAIPEYGPAPTPGTSGVLKGLKTVVTDIPQSVTDTANTPNRTVDYKLDKMTIDLISDLKDSTAGGYMPPLLTNPSKCGSYAITANVAPYGGGPTESISDPYTVDQCDTVRFDPNISTAFTDAVVPAYSTQGLVSTLTMPNTPGQPVEGGTVSSVEVRLPRGFTTNNPALTGNDMCPGNSGGPFTDPYFLVSNCNLAIRPQAKIGEMTLNTPLLDQSIAGYVYLIDKSPVPWLGVNVSDTIPGNPKGINFQILGISDLGYYDEECGQPCGQQIVSKFSGLPDAPLTSAVIDLDMGPRTKPNNSTVSGQILEMNDDESCQPEAEFSTLFDSPSGAKRYRVQTKSFSGCSFPKAVSPGSGPWGQETADTTPTFGFSYSGAQPNVWCGVDAFGESGPTGATDCTGDTSYTPEPLGPGLHTLGIGDKVDPTEGTGDGIIRNFVVNDSSTQDTTVPTTTLNAVPATTPDSTPGFTFNASETSSFQCSLDGGAFLPCGSAAGTASANYSIPADEELFASDETHTFAVRAQDTAGNVDLTPASATFKVVIPFAPTMSVNVSTTQARAHPEMTINIGNLSHEDVKDYALSLPDGFFGGLTGVQALCEIAAADNGTCGAGSQVGTVTATAVIDRSTVTTTGKVYLTKSRVLGDPAALMIDVTPKLQDVTFDPIRVPARLAVRGRSAQGIDSIVIDVPNTATSTENEVSEFDMRSISLTLKSNPAAPQPLLTNPSSCEPKAFKASFTGYDNTIGSYDAPFAATGCGALSFAPSLAIAQVERSTGGRPGPSTNIKRATIDLTALLLADPAGAGIKNVNLTMPWPITIDVRRLPFPCLDEQAAAKACPASAAIGTVTATTPLLSTPISGLVYVLKSPTSLPRLLIALRGDIDVDLIATNSFINATTKPQIVTQMDTLPDVPLTSFTMKINGFLTTRDNTCDTGPRSWHIRGAMAGFNGASSAFRIPLKFDCANAYSPTYNPSLKGRGKKARLSTDVIAQGGRQIKKMRLRLPKGLAFSKTADIEKSLAKLVIVRGDGKTLNAKCFKRRWKTTIEINFCKKKVVTASVQFKPGILRMKKKITRPRFKLIVTDSDNKHKRAIYAK
ncbi:MAG: hypothetical protein HYX29_02410 [Solirubrobacterales bacterium]|nr:hypothetical protein [Solirubrobacterales bacterium]